MKLVQVPKQCPLKLVMGDEQRVVGRERPAANTCWRVQAVLLPVKGTGCASRVIAGRPGRRHREGAQPAQDAGRYKADIACTYRQLHALLNQHHRAPYLTVLTRVRLVPSRFALVWILMNPGPQPRLEVPGYRLQVACVRWACLPPRAWWRCGRRLRCCTQITRMRGSSPRVSVRAPSFRWLAQRNAALHSVAEQML